MPFLICEKSKQKFKVDIQTCFFHQCPHIKDTLQGIQCGFKSTNEKRIDRRKKVKK